MNPYIFIRVVALSAGIVILTACELTVSTDLKRKTDEKEVKNGEPMEQQDVAKESSDEDKDVMPDEQVDEQVEENKDESKGGVEEKSEEEAGQEEVENGGEVSSEAEEPDEVQ